LRARRAYRLAGISGGLPLPSIRNRRGYHWFVVGTVCIGAFMAALDASIINIALPVLKLTFGVRMHMIEWVSLVYLLTLAGLIVPFGRLADIFGRRWMYAGGFVIFILGSLACGAATELKFLFGARIFQAIGAAMLQANSVSIITAATPASDRGKAIGIQASAQGIGLCVGPAVGGILLFYLNWRWIFLVNIPVGIVGTMLGILFLPKDEKKQSHERFDYLGALCLIPALVSLIYFLNMGQKDGWISPLLFGSYVVFAVCLAGFLFVEGRTVLPLVDLVLFRNRTFSIGNLTGILSFTVMYAVLLLTPFYLDGVERLTPFAAGLYLTIIPIGMTLFTPVSGMVADKYGDRIPTIFGMLLAAAGCFVLMFAGKVYFHTPLVIGLFLVGTGLGIFTPPNNSSVMGSVPTNRLGVAGGTLNMARTLGMSMGITLGGLTYQSLLSRAGVTESVTKAMAPVGAMVFAFRYSFMVIAAMAILAVILSAIRGQAADKNATN
jgi:EmrB/QacA subfamily drug resistance transporter